MSAAARGTMLLGLLLALPGVARASTPLQPGTDLAEHASVGAVVGADPTVLLYNPANLMVDAAPSTTGVVSVEMAPAVLQMTYSHPDYAPYKYQVVAPLTAVGGAWRPSDFLTLGLVAFPTGAGTRVQLHGLPIDLVDGVAGTAQVSTVESGSMLGVGGSVLLPGDLRLGLSVVTSYQSERIEIDLDGQEQPLEDGSLRGTSYRPVFGVRKLLGHLTLGASASPPQVQHMRGTSANPILGSTSPTSVEVTTYAPLTVRAGLAYRTGRLRLNAEYQYEGYAAGRSRAKNGMMRTDDTNLLDAHAGSLSLDWSLGAREALFCGLGHFSKDQGGGLFPGTRGPDDGGQSGMQFGNFDGFDRWAVGGGYKLLRGSVVYGFGGYVDYGTATVPVGEPQAGTYTLALFALSGSVAWRL